MKMISRAAAAAAMALALTTAGQASAQLLFWSGQAGPLEEAQAMREKVIKAYPGNVDFQSREAGPFVTRLEAEVKAGRGAIGLVGALHGDLVTYADQWIDLSDVPLGNVKVSPAFMELGKLGSGQQKYLPWMQATYVMVANKKALEFLPAGADVNALTYDQVIAWSKSMAEKTGGPKFGFPAGPQGLKHRFFQGFLLPAYTGSAVTKFRSAEAEVGWTKFRELWQYTNPASTSYNFMQEPLLAGDVWLAFDHIARVADAFQKRPDDFVAFPAPAGPKGRAFMPVLAGLAIPKNSPDVAEAKKVIAYMLQPGAQVGTLAATNFFPVTDAPMPADLTNAAKALGPAITRMTSASDALPALLPMGLGQLGGQFNQVFVDTFERAVLGRQNLRQVLDQQAAALRDVMTKANAPCWAPDPVSAGACPVE